MGSIFGGGNDRALALQQRQAAAAQRRQLGELAKQQAAVDEARAAGQGGARRGNRLLTYLAAGGTPTLGGTGDGSAVLGGG